MATVSSSNVTRLTYHRIGGPNQKSLAIARFAVVINEAGFTDIPASAFGFTSLVNVSNGASFDAPSTRRMVLFAISPDGLYLWSAVDANATVFNANTTEAAARTVYVTITGVPR
jgi:hypothetical protein